MKVEVDERGSIVLKEAYVGVLFETAEGNQYGVCMRDDTIEVTAVGDAPEPRVSRWHGDE